MEKIAMIRPLLNHENAFLDLDVGVSVEYIGHDQNFNCILKSSDLKFKLEWILKFELFEEFNQEIYSKIIFDSACEVLMNTFSFIRRSRYDFIENKSYDYFGSEDIPNTLFN